jgi:hypothetical protein
VAERGYYVFPIAVVDQFMKENGLPSAGEMHQVPLGKMREILGADAVLYITVEQYGTKYQILNAATIIQARAKLVDTRTELVLWEGRTSVRQNSNSGSGGLIGALVAGALTQIINSSIDAAHNLGPRANAILIDTEGRGLLYGPYHPKYDKGE